MFKQATERKNELEGMNTVSVRDIKKKIVNLPAISRPAHAPGEAPTKSTQGLSENSPRNLSDRTTPDSPNSGKSSVSSRTTRDSFGSSSDGNSSQQSTETLQSVSNVSSGKQGNPQVYQKWSAAQKNSSTRKPSSANTPQLSRDTMVTDEQIMSLKSTYKANEGHWYRAWSIFQPALTIGEIEDRLTARAKKGGASAKTLDAFKTILPGYRR